MLPLFCICQQVEITNVNFPPNSGMTDINGLAQDNNGYIWIADGNNGLYKYDGVNLISYKPERNNSNSLSNLRLECVMADSKGNIWIGNFNDGLDRYEPPINRFTHFKHNDNDTASICSNLIWALAEDKEGDIWMGTAFGLDMFETATGKFHHFKSNQNDAWAVIFHTNGYAYFP